MKSVVMKKNRIIDSNSVTFLQQTNYVQKKRLFSKGHILVATAATELLEKMILKISNTLSIDYSITNLLVRWQLCANFCQLLPTQVAMVATWQPSGNFFTSLFISELGRKLPLKCGCHQNRGRAFLKALFQKTPSISLRFFRKKIENADLWHAKPNANPSIR